MIFYKETDFQETPIGRFPKEWNVARLEDVCEKVRAGGTPLTSKKEYWNGDLPFVKIEDITLAGKYLTATKSFISKEGLNNSSAWLVPENSLLFAMYGSMGEVSINKIPVTTNQAILGIIPQDRDDVEFLYYWYSFFKPRWKKYAKPTTQANLTAEILRDSMIPLPSQKERRGIVGVLGVVDSVIAKTGEVIAKTERLKKGLMQTLLTRGIGHKEYKQTPIGTIPKTWEVVKLEEVIDVVSGQYFKFSEFVNNGVRCLKIDNVGYGEIVWKTATFLPTDYLQKFPELALKEDDIVMALNRPIIDNKVKVGMLQDGDSPSILYQRVGKIVIKDASKLNRRFLFFMLTGEHFKQQLGRSLIGTDQPYVRTPVLLQIKIPLPPISEQQRIAEILSYADRKLGLERLEKDRLERTKRGLMNLLLTGKIRVKVD
jgi:type I restriction enzyme S subunit